MQTVLVLICAGAFLYFTWNSFLLRVRLLLAPEPIGAARPASGLGLWLTFFGGATALLDLTLHRRALPIAVSTTMALCGVALYWYTSRVDLQLARTRQHATVTSAAEAAESEPEAGSPAAPTASVSVFAVMSTLVFWGCLFAAWQFWQHGHGWPMWAAAAAAVIGPWGYRRAHHPDASPLPMLVFAASLPATIILLVMAVLRIPPH